MFSKSMSGAVNASTQLCVVAPAPPPIAVEPPPGTLPLSPFLPPASPPPLGGKAGAPANVPPVLAGLVPPLWNAPPLLLPPDVVGSFPPVSPALAPPLAERPPCLHRARRLHPHTRSRARSARMSEPSRKHSDAWPRSSRANTAHNPRSLGASPTIGDSRNARCTGCGQWWAARGRLRIARPDGRCSGDGQCQV
jgi:hypothetical protein